MRIADNSELPEIKILGHVQHADYDYVVSFDPHMIVFPLSRYNDFYMGIEDNSEFTENLAFNAYLFNMLIIILKSVLMQILKYSC